MNRKILASLTIVGTLALSHFPSFAASSELRSSIQVSFHQGAEAAEEVNTPRLKKLAKITAAQAIQIGQKRFKGGIKQVDLENEDGNLIWSVEVGKHELSIDAGNGKILAIE